MSAPEHKEHPEYADGWFDALKGRALPEAPTAPYRQGWDNGAAAREMMRKNGFRQDGPRSFTKTKVIR